MNEVEVEVLNPIENWEKEISVPVELSIVDVPVQQIIINGQEQVVMGKACVLACPKCRTIIQQFQPGIPAVEVLKALNTNDKQQLNRTTYCQKCGQKLRIMREAPVEATYEEVKESTN